MNRLRFNLAVNNQAFGFYHKINHAIAAMKSFGMAHVTPAGGSENLQGHTILLSKNKNGINVWSWWTTTPKHLQPATGKSAWTWVRIDVEDYDWRW